MIAPRRPASAQESAARIERVRVYCRVRPFLQREREGWSFHDYVEQFGEQGDAMSSDSAAGNTKAPLDAADETAHMKGQEHTFVTDKGKIDVACSAISLGADGKTVALGASSGTSADTKDFTLDAVLPEETTQDQVYARVASSVVQDVLAGYNGTILAYGQTATGKTHTMMGEDFHSDQRGIVPRALQAVFDGMASTRAQTRCTVSLSYVQLYCERIFDLFSPETPSSSILIREDLEQGVYLEGASSLVVTSLDDAMQLIEQGTMNRAVANTDMNAQSSRSHAVLIVQVQRESIAQKQQQDGHSAPHTLAVSRLFLVDLAGSERVKKSHVFGRHVNELRAINLSLSALGNCISALSHARQQAQRHVPYRDSKLTRLLQSSLGGNAKTSLVVTISPSATEAAETLSTLQFGQRAMQVAVQAHVNVLSMQDYKALYEDAQQRLDESQQQLQTVERDLAKHAQAQHDLEAQLMNAHLRIQHLEFECQAARWSDNQAAPTKGDAADPADPSKTAWKQELAVLVQQHEADLAAIKQKCDQQVETYRRLADDAQQEWHTVQDELTTEKRQVLETLQELKDCKTRLFQLDENSTDRIAELVQDEKDKERAFLEEKQTLLQQVQSQTKQVEALTAQAKQAEEQIQRLSDQIDVEYVPKDVIQQMESLYESAISKLQQRVVLLEQRSTGSSNQQGDGHHGPASNAVASALPAIATAPPHKTGKAVPKIGRVMPAARATSLR